MDLNEIYDGKVKVIEENDKDGILKVAFPFCLAGVKNGNGRTYPLAILEREVKRVNEQISAGQDFFGFVGHPRDGKGELTHVSHMLVKLTVNEKIGFGEAKVLVESEHGKTLKTILKAGGKIGSSMRGTGTVSNGVVNEDYGLLGVDFVLSPSFGKDVKFDKSAIIEGEQEQLTEEQLKRLYGEAQQADFSGSFNDFKKFRNERKNLTEDERKAQDYIDDEAGRAGKF